MNIREFNLKNVILFSLVFILFVTKIIDAIFFELHLVNLVLLFFIAIVLLSMTEVRVNLILFFYICVLVWAIFNGFLIGSVSTGVWGEPWVTGYESPLQPVIGLFYSLRYMLLFGLVIGTSFVVSEDNYRRILNIILLLLFANCIFSYIEYMFPAVHKFLMSRTAHPEDFSFVYRGLSFLFNVYDASVSMIILSALAYCRYVLTRRKIYFFVFVLAFFSTILLGTRIGYVGLLVFWFMMILLSEYRFIKKLIFALASLVIFMCLFSILFLVSEDVRKILLSLISLEDTVGSIQLHVRLFFGSLRLISDYPFGLGIGKTNFAAMYNSYYFDPESFILSLALDAGIISVVLFLWYHWSVLRQLIKIGYNSKISRIYSALVVTLIIISLVNIQIFNSVLVSTVIPIIVGIYYNISRRRREAALT